MSAKYSAGFLAKLWRAVVRIDTKLTAREYRSDDEVRHLCRDAHANCRSALDRLVADGALLRNGGRRYWFEAGCKAPDGCRLPASAESFQGTGFALPRQCGAMSMPPDDAPSRFTKQGHRFDFIRCPSRIGNRLHHHDGRITDLDGEPIEALE